MEQLFVMVNVIIIILAFYTNFCVCNSIVDCHSHKDTTRNIGRVWKTGERKEWETFATTD